jgi:diacylglycerol kinase family enzyme
MTRILLINPRSGSGEPGADALADEARRRGVEPRLLGDGESPGEAARESRADVLGMAGGDGSLAGVATVAIERGLPFVCVPFGTRNHFARDVGLDRDDPIAALDAFDGDERTIDVGRAGERVFLNNVSFGVYARLVHHRERRRRRREALVRARALLLSLRERHPAPFVVDGRPVTARAVLVANNAYQLDLFNIGERERLDEGRLHLYVARGLAPTAWEERACTELALDAPGSRVQAAIDGEAAVLETPLRFRSDPGALRLLLPRGQHLADHRERELAGRRQVVGPEPREL